MVIRNKVCFAEIANANKSATMKTKLLSACRHIVALCAPVCVLACQALPPSRSVDLRAYHNALSIFCSPYTTEVRVAIGADTTGVTLNLPFDIDGDPDISDPSVILMVGTDSGTSEGRIQALVRTLSNSYVLGQVVAMPGRYPVAVVRSANLGRLFILDAAQHALLWAAYSGGSQLPTAWSVVPGSVGMAPLADGVNWLKVAVVEDAGATVTHLVFRQADTLVSQSVTVDSSGMVAVGVANDAPRLASRYLRPGDVNIILSGKPNASVEVVRYDCTPPLVVGSGLLNSAGGGTANFSAPSAYGWLLGARYAGKEIASAPFLSPLARFGTSEPIGPDLVIRPLAQETSLMLWKGHSHFSVPVFLDHEGPVAPQTFVGYLGVGYPQGISTVNGRVFLAAEFWLDSQVRVYDANEDGFGPGDLPLPDDADLVGVELAFQWVLFVGNGVVLSDVVCSRVLADVMPPPSWNMSGLASARAAGSGATSGVSVASAANRLAAVSRLKASVLSRVATASQLVEIAARVGRPKPSLR